MESQKVSMGSLKQKNKDHYFSNGKEIDKIYMCLVYF